MSYQPTEKLEPPIQREFQRVAQALNGIIHGILQVFYTTPQKPRDGQIAIADGVHWNPIGDGIKRPVWYDASAGVWKIFS